MNKFFVGLFIVTVSQANATVPVILPVTIHCESVDSSPAIQLNGVFQEQPNRHESGSLRFIVYPLNGPMTPLLSRTGSGQWISDSEIIYTDNGSSTGGTSVEANFADKSFDNGISNLTVNGKSIFLSCQVNVPSPNPPHRCSLWCDCHTCH